MINRVKTEQDLIGTPQCGISHFEVFSLPCIRKHDVMTSPTSRLKRPTTPNFAIRLAERLSREYATSGRLEENTAGCAYFVDTSPALDSYQPLAALLELPPPDATSKTSEVLVLDIFRDDRLRRFIRKMEKQLSGVLHESRRHQKYAFLADQVCRFFGSKLDRLLSRSRKHVLEICRRKRSGIVLLGEVRVGASRHRSLLFKFVCDRVGLPCILIRGNKRKKRHGSRSGNDVISNHCWSIVSYISGPSKRKKSLVGSPSPSQRRPSTPSLPQRYVVDFVMSKPSLRFRPLTSLKIQSIYSKHLPKSPSHSPTTPPSSSSSLLRTHSPLRRLFRRRADTTPSKLPSTHQSAIASVSPRKSFDDSDTDSDNLLVSSVSLDGADRILRSSAFLPKPPNSNTVIRKGVVGDVRHRPSTSPSSSVPMIDYDGLGLGLGDAAHDSDDGVLSPPPETPRLDPFQNPLRLRDRDGDGDDCRPRTGASEEREREQERERDLHSSLPVLQEPLGWYCSHCGTDNSNFSLFCNFCSEAKGSGWVCSFCSHTNEEDFAICEFCCLDRSSVSRGEIEPNTTSSHSSSSSSSSDSTSSDDDDEEDGEVDDDDDDFEEDSSLRQDLLQAEAEASEHFPSTPALSVEVDGAMTPLRRLGLGSPHHQHQHRTIITDEIFPSSSSSSSSQSQSMSPIPPQVVQELSDDESCSSVIRISGHEMHFRVRASDRVVLIELARKLKIIVYDEEDVVFEALLRVRSRDECTAIRLNIEGEIGTRVTFVSL